MNFRLSNLVAKLEDTIIAAGPHIKRAATAVSNGIAEQTAKVSAERKAAAVADLAALDPVEVALIEKRAAEIAAKRAEIAALQAMLKAAKRG